MTYRLNLPRLYAWVEGLQEPGTAPSLRVACPTCGAAAGQACRQANIADQVAKTSHGRRREMLPLTDRIKAILATFDDIEHGRSRWVLTPHGASMVPQDREAIVRKLRAMLVRGDGP